MVGRHIPFTAAVLDVVDLGGGVLRNAVDQADHFGEIGDGRREAVDRDVGVDIRGDAAVLADQVVDLALGQSQLLELPFQAPVLAS
jgi:hypothetical protein